MAKSYPYQRIAIGSFIRFEIGAEEVAGIQLAPALGPFIFVFIKYATDGEPDPRDRTFMLDPASIIIECGPPVEVAEKIELQLPRLEIPGGRAII